MNSNIQQNEYIVLCFKICYTKYTFQYNTNKNWSLVEFINNIKTESKKTFTFITEEEMVYFNIVPTGQYQNKKPPEESKKLENNNNITLIEKFGNELKNMSFYIRLKPEIQYEKFETNMIPIRTYYWNHLLPSCSICLENKNKYYVNKCRHEICKDCYILCIQTNNRSCCECRMSLNYN